MSEAIAKALMSAEPRPEAVAPQGEKKNYAERLSRALAIQFARALRPDLKGVLPNDDGTGQESVARSSRGPKKLDVNYSTVELGLGLGVSIKTINFADARSSRYTKNQSRVDNELRAEAMDYHTRQPYAVLVAIVFLPVDSALDGVGGASSFGAVCQYLRPRAGRTRPVDQPDLFERVFVGLYDPGSPESGVCTFWDVTRPPPRQGMPDPSFAMSFDRVIKEIITTYDMRNKPPEVWAD